VQLKWPATKSMLGEASGEVRMAHINRIGDNRPGRQRRSRECAVKAGRSGGWARPEVRSHEPGGPPARWRWRRSRSLRRPAKTLVTKGGANLPRVTAPATTNKAYRPVHSYRRGSAAAGKGEVKRR